MEAWALIVAVGSMIVGVLSLGVAVATYVAANPRKFIGFWHDAQPVINRVHIPDAKVLIRGVAFQYPQYVELQVVSMSRHDITSAEFDQGKSMLLHLHGQTVVVSTGEGARGMKIESVDTSDDATPKTLAIRPQLIRRRSSSWIRFISEGQPRYDFEEAIANVRVRRMLSPESAFTRRAVGAFAGLLASMAAIVIAGIILASLS